MSELVLQYGAENWTMKKLESRTETQEMWTYRRIGHISWKQKTINYRGPRKLEMKREIKNR